MQLALADSDFEFRVLRRWVLATYREDSTQPRVTLIGQKSIKAGLLELKLRMFLSLLSIMLG